MIVRADFSWNDLDFECDASVSPYRPATMYRKNGDPGDPEEGGEIKDLCIYYVGKDVTNIVRDEIFSLAEEAIAYAEAECDGYEEED